MAFSRNSIPLAERAQFTSFFRSLSVQAQADSVAGMSPAELDVFRNIPEALLFSAQEVPPGPWRYCIFRCGRRFGKSVTGGAWLATKVMEGAMSVGLYGPTYADIVDVMVKGVMSWFPSVGLDAPKYINHQIQWPNGAVCYCLTSDKENRGKSLEYLWADELVIASDGIPDKIKKYFDCVDTATSVGRNPQTLITTTPKPFPLFKEWERSILAEDPRFVLKTGTMFDNPYLSDAYRTNEVAKYGNTRMARQEIYGDLLNESEGALWNGEMIDATRITPEQFNLKVRPHIIRKVVAVDPAVTSTETSDLTGIVLVALDNKYRAWILGDWSGKYTPNEMSLKVKAICKTEDVDCVVVETNQGGDFLINTLKSVGNHTRFKKVHAKRGKVLRAEPVAAQFEMGNVRMVGSLTALENEMCSFSGNPKQASPDRLDAMVYAVTELLFGESTPTRDLSNLPFL